jgi:hypothetical protein
MPALAMSPATMNRMFDVLEVATEVVVREGVSR